MIFEISDMKKKYDTMWVEYRKTVKKLFNTFILKLSDAMSSGIFRNVFS